MKILFYLFPICLGLLQIEADQKLDFRSEHISVEFFIAGENADRSQNSLNEFMDKFYEHLQLNSTHEVENIFLYLDQSQNISIEFGENVKEFFNLAKNESERLLERLQNISSPPLITEKIKSQLLDYFSEMEIFKEMLCEILDDVTEFTLYSLRTVQSTLLQFGEAQNTIIERRRHSQEDNFCHNSFTEFLWQSAGEVIQCTNTRLHITYDIFSITKLTTYHVLKMLEHRIQKIHNCFLFGNYSFRCRFVKNAEVDFEKLYTRLDELQMYNEKQRRKIYRNRQRGGFVKCIPPNFPDGQMTESLKSCSSISSNNIVLLE
ncbi:uncharacterized protein LOC129917048 [Episyrphus balteatus]|uniref:uncharacterized protein LOC129917048 n=1 Tax=Episyrphus balteatus TaxID=286459 RepID=UPI002485E842|nr:uncharacterized protein LOC129917048 [Episyrphus balteatus]